MTHMLRAHQRNDDEIVLLPLKLVHCGDFHLSEEWIPCASRPHHISQQCLLAVVSGQNGDLLGWDAHEPHVHEERHAILSFSQILIEVWSRLRLSSSLKVLHIDELVGICKPWICNLIALIRFHVGQVPQFPISPAVELRNACPGSPLQVQVDGRRLQADEASVQGLIQMAILPQIGLRKV